MANALALFDPAAVPDHIKAFLEENSNIPASDSTPTLSLKGKVFSIVLGGEATKVMRVNQEGEEEAVQILPVVILASAERRGRNFYEGAYDPENRAAPVCWSTDGVKPDASITEPKASKCATCPLSAKGSKVTDNGKEAVACQEFRMIAVVPAHDLEFEPLRVRLPITSDFDGRNKEAQAKGWYGFKNYLDLLRSKGYKDTRALSTKLRFDPSAEYPKLQFSPGKWLTPEALDKVKALSITDGVKDLLVVKYTARSETEAPVDKTLPQSDDGEDNAPVVLTPAPKNPSPATGKAAVVEAPEDDEEEAIIAAAKARKAAKEAAVKEELKQKAIAEAKAKADADAAAKASAKAAVVEDGDDDEAIIQAAIARKKAKEAAAKAPAKASAKPAVVEVDDDAPPTGKPAGKPAGKAGGTAKPAVVSAAVAATLGKWGSEDDE